MTHNEKILKRALERMALEYVFTTRPLHKIQDTKKNIALAKDCARWFIRKAKEELK